MVLKKKYVEFCKVTNLKKLELLNKRVIFLLKKGHNIYWLLHGAVWNI